MDKELAKYLRIGRHAARKLHGQSREGICPDCNNNKKLDLHHIDGNTHNNDKSNITFLCHVCHLRRERKLGRVGSHTKLTQADIDRIRGNENLKVLAKEFELHPSYLRKIRTGVKVPVPYVPIVIPDDWVYVDRRGKPRALDVESVKRIMNISNWCTKTAKDLAIEYGVNISTIYKVHGRHGCYSDAKYN